MDVFLLQVSMDLLGAQSIINGDCSCIFPYMANADTPEGSHHAMDAFAVRQLLQCAAAHRQHGGFAPVSYTHLDVYKRQWVLFYQNINGRFFYSCYLQIFIIIIVGNFKL